MIVCLKAYRAHLVGKAHKKKEAQAEGGPAAIGGGNAGQKGHLYCQLCEVTCSSSDAYAAHIRGAKHQKVGCSIYRVKYDIRYVSPQAVVESQDSMYACILRKLSSGTHAACYP